MNPTNWQYKPLKEINNFKDLELEKQRLKLHQQFLGELLERDKLLLKRAIEPQQLFTSALQGIFSKDSNIGFDLGKEGSWISKVVKWIFAKFF